MSSLDFIVNMLPDTLSPSSAVLVFEPFAVGFVEVKRHSAQWIVRADWHHAISPSSTSFLHIHISSVQSPAGRKRISAS